MDSVPAPFVWKQQIFIVIDPAAGGPQSDFAIVSFYRYKGVVTVSFQFYYLIYSCRGIFMILYIQFSCRGIFMILYIQFSMLFRGHPTFEFHLLKI